VNLKTVLKGWGIAASIMVLTAVIAAVTGMIFDLGENILRIINLVGVCVAIFISSFGVSSVCDRLKLANALSVAILCVITLFVFTLIFCGCVNFRFLTLSVCAVASAALGTFLS